jgi:hypothetical protein
MSLCEPPSTIQDRKRCNKEDTYKEGGNIKTLFVYKMFVCLVEIQGDRGGLKRDRPGFKF